MRRSKSSRPSKILLKRSILCPRHPLRYMFPIIKGLAIALGAAAARPLHAAFPVEFSKPEAGPPNIDADTQKRMQEKIDNFNEDFPDDIFLTADKVKLLKQVQARLNRAQESVGYARFNLLSFDELLKAASDSPHVGLITPEEQA